MDTNKRRQLYKEAVEKDATPKTRFSDAFGVSNSAKVIGQGLFSFNANFESIAKDVDQVAVHCLLRFPPEDEIYFSIFIKSDVANFHARLEEMKAAGTSRPRGAKDDAEEDEESSESESSPDTLSYTSNNKNVKGYVAVDGKLYLRNKSYWDTMPSDLSTISKPVTIDKIVFGVYPPVASARRSVLAREFVGYLGSLIGREKIHEVIPWPSATAVRPEMQRMPSTLALKEIEDAVEKAGGHYPGNEVARYHGGLNYLRHKHFVILTGLSGTGKTQLAIKYAHAVHGVVPGQPDPFLIVCPVRPEWTDPTGLTGFYDVLSNRYSVPPFLEAMLLATAHPTSPVFVVLDEMNLARVEYYFSDLLSALETEEALALHASGVPLEGSTGIPVPSTLHVPPNLYITGTINIDETTNPVSDKVLDRAIVIDMAAVELAGFFTKLTGKDASLLASRAACEPILLSALKIMAPHGLGFGYRVAEEVVRYHQFAKANLGVTSDQIIDDLMVQKILVKLRGGEGQRGLLQELAKLLDLQRSKVFLGKLLSDLDEYGSFQATR